MAPRADAAPRLAAALLALAGACRRAPEKAETPPLSAPPAASTLVTTPLDGAATGFTNAMQADALGRDARAMGLTEAGSTARQDPARPATAEDRREELERLRSLTRRIAGKRRTMSRGQDRSVTLPGKTAPLLGSPAAAAGALDTAKAAPPPEETR